MININLMDTSILAWLIIAIAFFWGISNYLNNKVGSKSANNQMSDGTFVDEDHEIEWEYDGDKVKVEPSSIEISAEEFTTEKFTPDREGSRSTFNDIYLRAEEVTRQQQKDSAVDADGIDKLHDGNNSTTHDKQMNKKLDVRARIKSNPKDLIIFSEILNRPEF